MPELIHSFGHTFFRIEFQRIVLYYTFLNTLTEKRIKRLTMMQ